LTIGLGPAGAGTGIWRGGAVWAPGHVTFVAGTHLALSSGEAEHEGPEPTTMKQSFSTLQDIGADSRDAGADLPIWSTAAGQTSLADLARENAALRRRVVELEAFRTLAYRDPLTGLWNRRYFDERIAEELDRARRNPARRLSIMIIDVNDFKRLNDTLGHAEGDRALTWVANFLKSHLRAHDVCCRVGGDEFAVILPEVGEDGCETLMTRLREKLAWDGTFRSFSIGLSIGTSTLPTEVCSGDELMRSADRAMYRDKQRQKDHVRPALSSVA
jgi:diguanylate cyclase (GGDEF)-like protein